MPNYGFAIDLRKCIGCHACTVACKAEHQIPIGVNRCWVKTVEKGTFPDTRRFFFPVLCNQCDEAPCAKICPTNALFKRRDGIVDLHGDSCIGCRACMVACPYDQLFIDPNTHTAEKCNFCANRVENQLQPACVSVCPTECRIFGDLDDPTSEVAKIALREAISVRKPEKGTQPKVFYIAAEESAIQPEIATRPFIYKEGTVMLRPLGSPEPDPLRPGDARVDYDTPHVKPWGIDMAFYLLTKGIATGAMFLSVMLWLFSSDTILARVAGPAISLAFLTITAILLIVDLERPERFYYILIKPNWRSWMVWGAYFLTAQGAITVAWIAAGWFEWRPVLSLLVWPALVMSLLATCYTGFLFAQGLARDLWQGPHAAVDLAAQAIAEGAAVLMLAGLVPGAGHYPALGWVLAAALGVHLVFVAFDVLLAPSPTRHHDLAVAAIRRGPFARIFWGGAIACASLGLIGALFAATHQTPPALAIVALLALGGSFAWEYVWVEAGQSVPLS
ncbi:MAG TPA: NrfD/PsrC family molybdoenzyme membrane anchor subunit [Vicinamibacterales bacterium]|jgi:Fe-S-cluster-containing dehydrogenase component/formate-dependent nitrite reductase membrane component NrfD|nr:NrfD/PsrC family molybdoenzyme membrane anchor subunit [Vicinamibacterales bacterium]